MKRILFALFSFMLVFAFSGCVEPEEEKGIAVTFSSLAANGTANISTTTRLTLTFDKDIEGLAASDITLTANNTGAVKGALRKAEGIGNYTLNVSGITESGNISVTVAKTGFSFKGSPKTVGIHFKGTAAYPPGPLVDIAAQTTPLTGGEKLINNTSGNRNLTNSPYGYEVFSYRNPLPDETNKFIWYGPDQGGGGAFKAEWDGYYLVRLGFFWGNGGNYTQYKNIYIDYNYTRSANGTGGNFSWIGTYGWSRNPSAENAAEKLIEWYIVDDNFRDYGVDAQPTPGQSNQEKLGSFEVDGATYNIWKAQRTDQSIDGRQTFTQLFSIRDFNERRQYGTISVTEHFKEWSKYIEVGNLYEAKFKVEAGGGNGWLDLHYLYLSQEDNPRTN